MGRPADVTCATFNMRLPLDLKARLLRIARAEDRNLGAHIRHVLEQHVEARKKKTLA